ncbi:MAG: GNAT family N-acetyltransferase, partial [Robiginitomaculum sp.]|nr:GNAT family N-acetyltransferase [Robiginitomaculum sp.]
MKSIAIVNKHASLVAGEKNKSMYKIQNIGLESASILSQLWKDTFVQAYSDVHTPANIAVYCARNFSLDSAVSELKLKNVTCKVACTEAQAVGFYLLRENNCPISLEGPSTELKQIYILKNHYKKGLGKLLYDDAIHTMYQNGARYVWLSVSDINYRAQNFYKELEFTAVGPGPVFKVGYDRLTSTIMTKKLHTHAV